MKPYFVSPDFAAVATMFRQAGYASNAAIVGFPDEGIFAKSNSAISLYVDPANAIHCNVKAARFVHGIQFKPRRRAWHGNLRLPHSRLRTAGSSL